MVSTLKGNNNITHINRGKPYALMLLLAFGAAILGVMILHKIREKPVLSVIVKEKDDQLLNLHLLFQREKEFSKEARKKIEEMKTKIYSLRSQKMELNRKLLEMESTIGSLRAERKVIESALDEAKNEIKMLKEGRMNSSSGFLLHASLKEIIKMKEAEIEDLKLQLGKSGNINSGSNLVLNQNSDHISNPKMHEHGNRELNDAESVITSTTNMAALTEHGNRRQENSGNGGALVGTNLNTMETMKIRENEITKAVDASGDALNHDNRGQLDIHRGGQDLEKSYGFDSERNFGFRERKKNLKGKRSRESGKSRTGDRSQKRENETSKEEKGQGQRTGLVSDSIEGQVDDENDRLVLVSDGLKQKSAEIISNRSQSHEASGKLEMMQDTDVDKSRNENEKQDVAEKEETVTEELEDAETHEPEIHRADIQRFSESEETEETEF